MLTEKQCNELSEKVCELLRLRWGDEFTDIDTVRIHGFCMDEVNEEIPYPFSEVDIRYVADEFELRHY